MPDLLQSLEVCLNGGASLPKTSFSMPPSLLAVKEHIRRMRGGSQAHLMRCVTDSYYVVKFQGNPQGTKILANDLLGTQLATRLGLPTTPVAICHVGEPLIKLTHDLYFEVAGGRIPCRPGLQFGSRFPLDPRNLTVWDFVPDKQLVESKNLQDFAGMLVFDKWTCNTDGRQTIFYHTEKNAPFQAVMIDQGFCFNAAEWNFPDAPMRGLYPRRVVYEHVRGLDDFEPWLSRLESELDWTVLTEIAQTIPPEWYESDAQSLERLLERLDRRRSRVRELLWDTWRTRQDVFPNWSHRVPATNSVFS